MWIIAKGSREGHQTSVTEPQVTGLQSRAELTRETPFGWRANDATRLLRPLVDLAGQRARPPKPVIVD